MSIHDDGPFIVLAHGLQDLLHKQLACARQAYEDSGLHLQCKLQLPHDMPGSPVSSLPVCQVHEGKGT